MDETLRASRVIAEAPLTGLRKTTGDVPPMPATIGFNEATGKSEGKAL